MKKFLCLALVIIMTASLAMSVGAAVSVPAYDSVEDGTLLYEVNFASKSGSKDGVSEFIDGRGDNWYSVNPQVSADGKAVTVQYTTTEAAGTDKAPEEDGSRARARYASQKMSAFKTAGNSYTVEFTIDSKAYVGVMLDGNTGFIINPALNSTSVGQAHKMTNMPVEVYDGTGASKQTYAIEMTCSAELSKSFDGSVDVYAPTVYRLLVKDEVNNNWRLVREITDEKELSRFEFEEGYDYFYFAVTRYGDDVLNYDTLGTPVTSTVSDVKIFKGIDFLEKGESAIIEEEEEENTNTENGENGENAGNSVDVQDIPSPEDFAPPTAVTTAPETTEAETEAEAKSGCGASVSYAGIALVVACSAGLAVKTKKKEDN